MARSKNTKSRNPTDEPSTQLAKDLHSKTKKRSKKSSSSHSDDKTGSHKKRKRKISETKSGKKQEIVHEVPAQASEDEVDIDIDLDTETVSKPPVKKKSKSTKSSTKSARKEKYLESEKNRKRLEKENRKLSSKNTKLEEQMSTQKAKYKQMLAERKEAHHTTRRDYKSCKSQKNKLQGKLDALRLKNENQKKHKDDKGDPMKDIELPEELLFSPTAFKNMTCHITTSFLPGEKQPDGKISGRGCVSKDAATLCHQYVTKRCVEDARGAINMSIENTHRSRLKREYLMDLTIGTNQMRPLAPLKLAQKQAKKIDRDIEKLKKSIPTRERNSKRSFEKAKEQHTLMLEEFGPDHKETKKKYDQLRMRQGMNDSNHAVFTNELDNLVGAKKSIHKHLQTMDGLSVKHVKAVFPSVVLAPIIFSDMDPNFIPPEQEEEEEEENDDEDETVMHDDDDDEDDRGNERSTNNTSSDDSDEE